MSNQWQQRIKDDAEYWQGRITEDEYDYAMRWLGITFDGWETGFQDGIKTKDHAYLLKKCMDRMQETSSPYERWRSRGLFAALGLREVERALEAKGQANGTEEGGQPS